MFCWLHRLTLVQRGRRQHKCVGSRKWGTLGTILDLGYHSILVYVFFVWIFKKSTIYRAPCTRLSFAFNPFCLSVGLRWWTGLLLVISFSGTQLWPFSAVSFFIPLFFISICHGLTLQIICSLINTEFLFLYLALLIILGWVLRREGRG